MYKNKLLNIYMTYFINTIKIYYILIYYYQNLIWKHIVIIIISLIYFEIWDIYIKMNDNDTRNSNFWKNKDEHNKKIR